MVAAGSAVALFAYHVARNNLDGPYGFAVHDSYPETLGHIETTLPPLVPHMRQAYGSGLKPGIVDIGANVGDFTSRALHLFTELVHRRDRALWKGSDYNNLAPWKIDVTLVEASLKTSELLQARVERERWDLVANYSIIRAAAAKSCDQALFLSKPDFAGDTTQQVVANNNMVSATEPACLLACMTLNDILAARRPTSTAGSKGGVVGVFFLKIDIEGGDIPLLLSATSDALEYVRFVGFEHKGERLHPAVFRKLRHLGFACFLVHSKGLLPLFGGVLERVNWLLSTLPGYFPTPRAWSYPVGDVFCGRGCDEALLDVIWMIERDTSSDFIRHRLPALVQHHLAAEFQCIGQNGTFTGPGFRLPTKLNKKDSQHLRQLGHYANLFLNKWHGQCPELLDEGSRWQIQTFGILGSRLMWDISDEFGASSRKLGHDIVRRAAALCDPPSALLHGNM